MALLRDLKFVDMVLDRDFCDVKMASSEVTELVDVQARYSHDIDIIRQLCDDGVTDGSEQREFTIAHDTMRFRVTEMYGPIWFLSRIDASVRPIEELPVPRHFVSFVLRPRLTGLILVTGGFGAGKTTTASSLFTHRIHHCGGTGIALEDPTAEIQMAGRHGHGRIVQIPVSRSRGGYQAALQAVRRTRADVVFVGEIRDAHTAREAQDIANTDMPVLATMHASSIEEALDKYQAYLRTGDASSSEANARLAMSVAGVIHQTKEYVDVPNGSPRARFTNKCLLLDRTRSESSSIIGKIREGNFMALNDDIEAQAARYRMGRLGDS